MVDSFLLNLVLRGAGLHAESRALPRVATHSASLLDADEPAQSPAEFDLAIEAPAQQVDSGVVRRQREPALLAPVRLEPLGERPAAVAPATEAPPVDGAQPTKARSQTCTSALRSIEVADRVDARSIERTRVDGAKPLSSIPVVATSPEETSRCASESPLPPSRAIVQPRGDRERAVEREFASPRPLGAAHTSIATEPERTVPLRASRVLDQVPPSGATEPQPRAADLERSHSDLTALLGRLETLVDHLEASQRARQHSHLTLALPMAARPSTSGFSDVAVQRRHADRTWY